MTKIRKYCILPFICGILKRKKKIKLLETENRIVVARDWEVGKQGKVGKRVQTVIRQNFGKEWAKWIKRVERHKLPVLR